MFPNFLVLAASALIPFAIAFVWYHPKVFGGDTWADLVNLTDEQRANDVKPLKLALSILLNFLIAFAMYNFTVHASGVFGLLQGDTELITTGTAAAFLAEHGQNFTTFGHGLAHGILATIVFVIPLIGYATIFERRSAKYFFVNVGFWLISLMLMCGVISQWGWKLIV